MKVKNTGVCESYAKAMYELLNAVGIEFGYVSVIKAIEKYDVSYEKSIEEGVEYTHEEDIENEVLKNFEIKRLRQALKKLSSEEREFILYCYSNGHGAMREYSKIKRIKYGTLQKRKKSILNKIKKYMM